MESNNIELYDTLINQFNCSMLWCAQRREKHKSRIMFFFTLHLCEMTCQISSVITATHDRNTTKVNCNNTSGNWFNSSLARMIGYLNLMTCFIQNLQEKSLCIPNNLPSCISWTDKNSSSNSIFQFVLFTIM